jgi:hypothetical protein
MKDTLKKSHVIRIISEFDIMFDSNAYDDVPTRNKAAKAIIKAYDEGTINANKERNDIHLLAESWIQNQDFRNISFDDAIFDAFVTGANPQ